MPFSTRILTLARLTLRACLAVIFLTLFVLPFEMSASVPLSGAAVSVTLSSSAAPATAQPGSTVTLTGTGFPAGTLSAAGVTVTLTASSTGAGPTVSGIVISASRLFASTGRIVFEVPPALGLAALTPYNVSVSGSTSGGSFESSNTAALSVTPQPSITAVLPGAGTQGQTLQVTISGNFTSFLQGSTLASFGAGISVGGGAKGAAGPVSVTSANTAVAQIVIDPAATVGSRTIAVQTGTQALSAGFLVSASQVAVPNVVGLSQGAASSAITSAGLVVGTVTQQASSTVASGNVISQSPVAATSVASGSAVNLVVSTGPAKVAVPNVVGLSQAAVSSAITGAGLVVGTVTQQASSTVASGNVISQSPVAATSVASGSAVNLVVSTGPAKAAVPNVVGLTQAAASSSITGAGLVVGTVTQQASSTVASGNVISESPVAATSVNTGSAVNLVVSTGPAQAAVPNVVGLTQAAASSAITGAGLVVGTVTQQASSTVASGNVISQSPVAAASVVSGSAVNLVVSTGPAKVAVPNVVGLSQAAASSAITGAGLVVGTVTQQASSTVASGNVISQSPVAATSVASGSAVNLVVSTGPAKVAVPNVVGLSQGAASSAITGAGLVVGTVTQQASSTVASGNVISQSPVAATSVASGSAVNLVVSTGPAKVAVPNVVGLSQGAASSAITGAGLVVGTVTQQASSTVASGSVISQSPAASTSVNTGSAVALVVSTGPAKVAVPNVVGLTQAAASSAITGAGLVVGTVTQQASSTVASGNIISESPAAATSVNIGSAVNLVVSTGPAQVAVPNVVGDTQATATSAITGAGLVLGTVTQQASSTVASGNVISESPAAATSVNTGSAVNLVISTGPVSTGPASIVVNVSAQVLAPNAGPNDTNGIVTVTPVALDSMGQPINGSSLQFTITVTAIGPTSGSAPVISGNTITFPKLNKKLLNPNTAVDPNGNFADTDPTDPNYGKQTGGVYKITASLANPALSGSNNVVVLPSGTASTTVQVYNFGSQLNAALNQIDTAYGNKDITGFNNAKTALQAVLNTSAFTPSFLAINQALAPPDGQLISSDQITGAGLTPGANDAAWLTALQNVDTSVLAAITAVNAVSPTSPTAAQVATVQMATAAYKVNLATLSALQPSSYALAVNNDFYNQVLNQDIPTLLAAVETLVSNAATPLSAKLQLKLGTSPMVVARVLPRMHLGIQAQFLDVFFGMFGACFDLESAALTNIVTLSISLANDVANLEAAGLINKNAPPGLSIDLIIGSSSLSFIVPNYSPSEVDAFGLDPNPANDQVVVVGGVNSGLLGNLLTFSPPKNLGAGINLIYNIYTTVRDISKAANIVAIVTPDQFVPGGGLFSDGSDALIFNSGFPQVNQSSLPVVGIIIVTNAKAGTYAAQTVDYLP